MGFLTLLLRRRLHLQANSAALLLLPLASSVVPVRSGEAAFVSRRSAAKPGKALVMLHPVRRHFVTRMYIARIRLEMIFLQTKK